MSLIVELTKSMQKARAAGRAPIVVVTPASAAAVTGTQTTDERLKRSTWLPLNRTSAGRFRAAAAGAGRDHLYLSAQGFPKSVLRRGAMAPGRA